MGIITIIFLAQTRLMPKAPLSLNVGKRSRIVGDSIAFGLIFALTLTVIQRLIGFGRGIIFCRVLPEDQLGQWSMVYSFLLLLAPLAVLGLPGSFCRYVEHYRQSGQLGTFLKRLTSVSAVTAIVFSAAMFLFPRTFSWIIFRQSDAVFVVHMMAAALSAVVGFNYLTSLLEALRQVRLVSIMRFVAALSFAVIALYFALTWENSAAAVTCGFAISCLIGCAPAVWFLIVRRDELGNTGDELPARSLWAKILPFATWMWLINLVTNVYEVADRWMLLHLSVGTDQQAQSYVGQYHSGRVLPLLLVGVAIVLQGFLMPYMSASWEKGQVDKAKAQLRWTLKLVAIGFTGVGLALMLFAPLLFSTFLQGRFDDGLSVMPLTFVYCIWYSLIFLGQDYLFVAEKGKIAVAAITGGLIINLVANFLLIPYYGLYGAVAATAFSNLVCLAILYQVNQRFGWSVDRGTWITLFVPLVLLLSPIAGIASFSLLLIACVRFDWVFDPGEKLKIETAIGNGVRRFWRRPANQNCS
jgi:O-antigen/teichoic acid export membrane protein